MNKSILGNYPKPSLKPECKNFSSGPCAKFPGFKVSMLENALLGRSHRSLEGKKRLKECIALTREILAIPENYKIAIVAGSDTGAFSMAMWNLLGPRPITALAWDIFGKEWVSDIKNELKLPVEERIANPGQLPNLKNISSDNDIVFTWHGTTSGRWLPNADWIKDDRQGLTFCDAISAVFVTNMPWDKLDVTSFAWQKGIGSEASHGMVVLSPRAIERLESYCPDRAIPKIFRFKKQGQLNNGLFEGETLNTPSMLCVEDYMLALNWIKEIGGMKTMIARSQKNLETILQWLEGKEKWIRISSQDQEIQSHAAVCLELCAEEILNKDPKTRWGITKSITSLIEQEDAGYDINGHIMDMPYIRIWIGPTVEWEDIEKLLPWIEWAYNKLATTQESN
jgi:phosphoserine aminotransferase